MKPFVLIAPLLLSSALAGGSDGSAPAVGGQAAVALPNITSRAALGAIAGVRVLESPPYLGKTVLTQAEVKALGQHFNRHNANYTVSLKVRGVQEQVFVTPGGIDNSATVNSLNVYVNAVTASTAQREALVRVATGFLGVCSPGASQRLSDSFWQARLRQPWEKDLGWKEKTLGQVKVGWSGREGLSFQGPKGPYRASLTLEWPKDSGRCIF